MSTRPTFPSGHEHLCGQVPGNQLYMSQTTLVICLWRLLLSLRPLAHCWHHAPTYNLCLRVISFLLPYPRLCPTNDHALLVSAFKSFSDSQSPCFLHVLWFQPSVAVVRWSPPCCQSLISTHIYWAPVKSWPLCLALQKVSLNHLWQ